MNILTKKNLSSFFISYIPAVVSIYALLIAIMYKQMLHIDYELLLLKIPNVLGVAIIAGLIGTAIPRRFVKLKNFSAAVPGLPLCRGLTHASH